MLNGPELGAAIEAARIKKGVTKVAMAEYFGVQPPSIQDWVKRGTIDKAKLPALWQYFSDVANASHWGLDDWEPIQHPSEGAKPRGAEAHVLSHPQKHSPQFINWGEILEKAAMPDRFVTAIPDDSMTPRLQAGQHIELATGGTPTAGSGVLVRDGKGRLYFRAYRPGTENDEWEAFPLNPAYKTLDSARDQLQVVAVLHAVLGDKL